MKAIRGRYRPIETVSIGGQGEVTKAMDEQHSRQVALKTRRLPTDEARLHALAEAQILLTMRPHPGLPILREDFFEGDRFHLVMDWVDGTNLQDRLRTTGPFSPDEVLALLEPVAEAIDHLHSHDPPIVHRDIKPANLILTPEGRTIVVDLGIAVSGTSSGGGSGTRGFSAPEVVSGEPVTVSADIFSFAATAFALLFGEPPRPGLEFGFAEADEDRARLFEIGLTKGLAFDPTKRPPSAMALLDLMRSGAGIPNNLVVALTRFVGREADLDAVARLLGEERLLTLTGTGGMGKTRLAEQTAAAALPRFEGGVWFVRLEVLKDGSLIASKIANAIGAHEPQDPQKAIIDSFGEAHSLLILDNCEHLLPEVSRIVRTILGSCSKVTVMATSRSPLGIEGERVFRVAPMSSPPATAPVNQMLSHDAVRLFIERAERADPSFRLDESNASDVSAICATLDGIPLALELAAARCSVMTPAEIRARLSDRFRIASDDGGRDLRSTIDWSYDLLSAEEAGALRTLAVFSGGFELGAAESLGIRFEWVSSLVEKSLVGQAKALGGKRFRMLETIRTYASEKASEEELFTARNAHLDWFMRKATDAESRIAGPEQKRVLTDLETEHDNMRAALEFAFSRDDVRGAEIAASMWRFWDVHGHSMEGRAWLARALGLTLDDPVLEARLLRADGGLALSRGELDEAKSLLSKSAGSARESGTLPLAAASLSALAAVEGSLGNLNREKDLYIECLVLWQELGHERGVATTLGNLGTCTFDLGDYASSAKYLQESLIIRERLKDEHGIASSKNGLGLICLTSGDFDRADAHLQEAAKIWDSLGYRRGAAIARTNMATMHLMKGQHPEAKALFDECAADLREVDANRELAEAMFGLAEAERMDGDPVSAAKIHLACLKLRWDIGDKKGWRESVGAAVVLAQQHDPSNSALLTAQIDGWKATGFVPSPIAWLADREIEKTSIEDPSLSDEAVMKMAAEMLAQL